MRFKTVQVIAAQTAAVAFVLAFMAAGMVIVSGVFMVVGLAAIGWLAWTMVRRVKVWGDLQQIRERRRKRVA